MKKNSICLCAEVYVSDDMSDQNGDIVVVLSDHGIHMTQCNEDIDGNKFKERVIIWSEVQARSMIMAINAMSAAHGWEL